MNLKYKNSTINYTVDGEGETIVLLHGFLETIDMWKHLIPELSKNRQVICIDLLGHGKTGCIGYLHTMDDMAEAVFAVLNHLNVDKANIVGHSMGGYVALALAEKHPELFTGLCLMNSTFEADDEARKNLRKQANEMVKRHFESLIRMSFAKLFAPESRVKFQHELEEALQIALKTPVRGYIAASEGMRLRPDYYSSFKKLDCKKLIIIGQKDWIVDSDKIKSQIKDTDINYVEFSEGHMSHIENKSELSYFIKLFVEK